MKEAITLTVKEAEEIALDLIGWAEVLAGDNSLIEWQEDMIRHAQLLKDKLAGRIE